MAAMALSRTFPQDCVTGRKKTDEWKDKRNFLSGLLSGRDIFSFSRSL